MCLLFILWTRPWLFMISCFLLSYIYFFLAFFCSFFAVFSHYLHIFLSFSVPYILLSPLLIFPHLLFTLQRLFSTFFFLSLLHCLPFFLIPCSFFLPFSLTPSPLSPATFCLILWDKKSKVNQVFFAVAQICSFPALFYCKTFEKSLYTATHFSNNVALQVEGLMLWFVPCLIFYIFSF